MAPLPKTPTGIVGIDEITGGGLPRGRPTLVCGSAGCGKTLFAMEFLVRGAIDFGEPGVFMAFEETAEDLEANVRSLGFDLPDLEARGRLAIDHVVVEREQIEETGEYNLDGLFVRLGHAIDSIGAKRVVLDTLESLFTTFSNTAVLRAELRRLFRWLKDKGVTAVITAERGEGSLTRQGLEEYVSDCVIALDHRVTDELSTRRLRIVKYRGSAHGSNEYPFLIDERGFSVLPITSLRLAHPASEERVSTGIGALDEMLGGGGYYRGTSVLVSGTAGSGKSSICAHYADASCRRGERCLYLAFEESPDQIVRNMRSIGLDLGRWLHNGRLAIHSSRPSTNGLEAHLVTVHRLVEELKPRSVIVDPMTNLLAVGSERETRSALERLLDYLKGKSISAVFTSLTQGGNALETTSVRISSLIDTWILLQDRESNGERNRLIYVLKSRGMQHSNQVREFLLTNRGVRLRDVYSGSSGVLTGSARLAQEMRDRDAEMARRREVEQRETALVARRQALEAELGSVLGELPRCSSEREALITRATGDQQALEGSRGVIASDRSRKKVSKHRG